MHRKTQNTFQNWSVNSWSPSWFDVSGDWRFVQVCEYDRSCSMEILQTSGSSFLQSVGSESIHHILRIVQYDWKLNQISRKLPMVVHFYRPHTECVGRLCFEFVCNSIHRWGGGFYLSRGGPYLRRGVPYLSWGVTLSQLEGDFLTLFGVPPTSDVHPGPLSQPGPPPPGCYAAGGMPLAVTQEDCHVFLIFGRETSAFVICLLWTEHLFSFDWFG